MKSLFFTVILIVATSFHSCEPDEFLAALDETYIPAFSNGWSVQKGPQTGLFFINAVDVDQSKGTGRIEGSQQSNGEVYKVRGSFLNTAVELEYVPHADNFGDNGPYAGTKYKGKYDTIPKPYLIRLVNVADASDSLVLRQG
jgi:hypothetical protein